MTTVTPTSAPDVASPLHGRGTLPERPPDDHLETLLQALTASWRAGGAVVERRTEPRVACDLPAVLVPLDKQGNALPHFVRDVQIRDLSGRGIGIAHSDPMPHRVVLVAFQSTENEMIRLMVRLKWCRFTRAGTYESGGQIVKFLPSDEGPASG